MTRSPEPGDGTETELLQGWLAFHRDALAAKCAGLSPDQLVTESAPPSDLTLLGLVRHLTEMEHVYLVHALRGGGTLRLVHCTDEDPDADIVGLGPDLVPGSFAAWERERSEGDALLAQLSTLDDKAAGNRFSVRWNLVKLLGEYARHNGHADLIRERIDGATGE